MAGQRPAHRAAVSRSPWRHLTQHNTRIHEPNKTTQHRRAELQLRISRAQDCSDVEHPSGVHEAFARADDGKTPLYTIARNLDGVALNMVSVWVHVCARA